MRNRIRRLHHRHRYNFYLTLRFATYLLAFFLLCTIYWVNDNFGEPSLEQILYHLQFGAAGLVDADKAIAHSFINSCLLLPVPLAMAALLLEKLLRQARTYALNKALSGDSGPINRFMGQVFKLLSWIIGHKAPLFLLLFSIGFFAIHFSAVAYVRHMFGKDYFAANYIYPAKVNLIPAKRPKNLVLIYVESLEDSYRDPRLFGRNLLASLDALDGVSFNTYRQAPGTGWTIAGITATQCGIPLKTVTMFNINDQGENISSFLPNAVCLGDVLSQFGYTNVYMGGDALAFSGKGKFFQSHHYQQVYGRDELKEDLTEADMNFWGLYDDDLLQKVKAKLKELHSSGQRFNLTITTIDTHGPDGHYSKWCLQQGAKDFAGIVECTSDQVAELVKLIKRSGYLKDTNVVILGDHLVMSNPVSELIDKVPQRHVFNAFISKKPLTKNRENIVHFDVFPTILEFIGIKVDGGKLGLGYSAISKSGLMPAPSQYEDMEADLLNKSDEYLGLWGRAALEQK
ncbi:MAG TPA: sulfatase-like hydrolase/transferase [Methylophilaceae bacterium]|nr:sulfatase-like hydrolase/transferase [Methylophilaceae bacterium]